MHNIEIKPSASKFDANEIDVEVVESMIAVMKNENVYFMGAQPIRLDTLNVSQNVTAGRTIVAWRVLTTNGTFEISTRDHPSAKLAGQVLAYRATSAMRPVVACGDPDPDCPIHRGMCD